MGYRIILLLFLSYQTAYSQKISDDISSWKQLSVCLCLKKKIPISNQEIKEDGSVAGYLQTNETFGIEDFEKTQAFIDEYLQKSDSTFRSKDDKSLNMMKCLNLFNDSNLDCHIKSLLKEH